MVRTGRQSPSLGRQPDVPRRGLATKLSTLSPTAEKSYPSP
jgi:hypothetical protein